MSKYINKKAISIAIFVIILTLIMMYIELYTSDPLLINEHIHIALEVIGSTIIILVAIILTVFTHNWEYNMSGFIVGFLLMGFLDLFHSLAPTGNRFVFIHSIAGIFGGFGILATILMSMKKHNKSISVRSLIFGAISSFIISFILYSYDRLIPSMIIENEFTIGAIILNIVAGVLFLISSIYFYVRLVKNKSQTNLLFFSATLLMGISNITFQFSELWCISWWTWHILRLISYVILLGFILILIQEDRKKLIKTNNEITQINDKLNEYTYIISHDLKEPIRSIRTFSQFIMEDYENQFDDTGKDYFNRIITASNKMANMIDDLLILSRVGKREIEFKTVDFNEMLEEIKFEMSDLIKANSVKIHYNKLPNIICQPTWMKMVFVNLINNSIKYSNPNKDYVDIRISLGEDPRDSSNYIISISDNGMGIESNQHEKIFDLFRRAYSKNDKEGSGAGLAIVRSIIQQHSGHIWVEKSKIGVGTTISFSIKKRGA